MLSQLSVRNFALLEDVSIEFDPGFNVLTGETGAGKTLLIDAISAALGERQPGDVVRDGTQRAVVEACFEISDPPPGPLGEATEEGMLVLGREIAASGRSVYRLNGRMCTAAAIREVVAQLIDLHGQHEHQLLLDPARHAEFLDNWAGAPVLGPLREVQARHAALRETTYSLARLRRSTREMAQKADLYRFQVEEIDAAALRPGEEAALEADRVLLANAEKLRAASGAALHALADAEPGAADLLGAAARQVASAREVDPRLDSIAELLETAAVAAQEASRELRRYHETVDLNPGRIEEVMERVELLRRLKRKYGDSVEQVLAYRDRVARELEVAVDSDSREADLAARQEELAAQLSDAAERLIRGRQEAARGFDRAVLAQLRELNMEKTRFETRVQQGEAPASDSDLAGVTGAVEFLISPNPGEPLRPLARIASGGEISRVMLALKSVHGRRNGRVAGSARTLIFDEIDAGIGGRTASVLGRKLAGLAGGHQVLCVTHLPQIACMATAHFHISKEMQANRTVVEVHRLQGGSRVAEIARMLGGSETTAVRHAEQLLAEAHGQPAGIG